MSLMLASLSLFGRFSAPESRPGWCPRAAIGGRCDRPPARWLAPVLWAARRHRRRADGRRSRDGRNPRWHGRGLRRLTAYQMAQATSGQSGAAGVAAGWPVSRALVLVLFAMRP